MSKKLKIFLDTSALISGLNSPTGAAGLILSAFMAEEFFIFKRSEKSRFLSRRRKVLIFISDQVIEEVQRNIKAKFPLLGNRFLSFLLARPKIVKRPTIKEIREAYRIILTNDAPVLAAVIKSKPDFLITWNTKHFMKKEVISTVNFTICTPKEFLQKYWKRR